MNVGARLRRALAYFTCIPIGRGTDGPPEPDDVALLPFVGALVGFASGSLASACARIMPPRLAAAVAFAGPIVLTGALHLDGFLDMCDALFAPVDVERRREILRDPRHGSFAVAGGSIVAIGSYAALCETAPKTWPAILAHTEGTARLATLIAAAAGDNSGGTTSARAFARPPGARTIGAQAFALLVLGYATGAIPATIATIALLAGTVPASRAIAARFDGELSGDAYGFTITLAALALLGAHAIAQQPLHENR